MMGLAAFVVRLALQPKVDTKLSARILERIRPFREAEWTCGDGARIPVQAMSESHLFYAIAKASRGEYPASPSRHTAVKALKAEALRRLAGLPGTIRQDEALLREVMSR